MIDKSKLKFRLLLIMFFLLAGMGMAVADVQLPHGKFTYTVTDLQVKVMGGHVAVKRTWYQGEWHFNRAWNDLIFVYDNFVDDKTSVSAYATIERNDEIYNKVEGSQGIYKFGKQKTITVRADGIRWQNVYGDWIEYNRQGQMLSYGNKNNVKVTVQRNVDGNITGVFDHFAVQMLWFEYTGIQLTAVYDADTPARRVEYQYSGSDLVTVTDVLNHSWSYAYDAYGKITSITDPELRKTTIAYNANGKVLSIESPDQFKTKYDYDYDSTKKEYYVRETSPEGVTTDYWYNKDGLLIRKDIAGETIKTVTVRLSTTAGDIAAGSSSAASTTNTITGRKLLVKDRNGNTTIREYDYLNRLVKITFPDKTERTYTYSNRFSTLTSRARENGVQNKYEYDGRGNLVRLTEAVGLPEERIIEYTYDEYGNQTSLRTLADANTVETLTQYTYDTQGNLKTVTDAEANVETYFYDIMGNITITRDANSKDWETQYDLEGKKLKTITPLGFATSYTYDKAGNLISTTDPLLKTTDYEYDGRSNLKKITDTYGGVYTQEYDSDNRLTAEISQEGKKYTNQYDTAGRRIIVTNGNGIETRFQYPNASEPGAGAFGQAGIVQYKTFERYYTFDSRNRTTHVTAMVDGDAMVNGVLYDAVGNIIALTDRNGKQTFYEYDGLNRQIKVINATGSYKSALIDDRDNTILITDENGKQNSYEYDRNNRLIKETRSLGQTTTYKYDPVGNRIEKITPKGEKTVYIHDADGRQTGAQLYATATDTVPVQSISFEYDGNDNLTVWNDGTYSAVFVYDDLNRKTSETVNYGSFSLSYSYAYYKDGYQKSFTTPEGVTYSYVYDNNNQLLSITIPGQGAITYNTYNWTAPTRTTYPGGMTRDVSYTGLLSPATISVRDPATNIVANLEYRYGRMQHVEEKNTDTGNSAYVYDDDYRLLSATRTGHGDESFELDPVGNRTSSNVSVAAWQYNENDELEQQGDYTYTYDDNGNLISKTGTSESQNYFYDISSRLIRVEDGSSTIIARYGYDPFDRRLWKEVGGVRSYYFYSDEGLIGEYDSSGAPIVAYGYLPHSSWSRDPLFLKNAEGYFYYQNDHLGTPYKLLSGNGKLVWSASYDSFGMAMVSASSSITNALRFPGQYYDSETGLHYNWRRYYDPEVGRYITPDPIGTGGAGNLYAYVDANPITYIDPTGECGVAGLAAGEAIRRAEALITGECVSAEWYDYVLDAVCVGVATKGVRLAFKYRNGLLKTVKELGKKTLDKIGKGIDKLLCKLNSFTGDTLVQSKDGLKAIKDIQVGELVWSYAEWNGENSYQPVTDLIRGEKIYEMVLITLKSGERIQATDEHPLYVQNKGWRDAKLLKKGDRLYLQGKGSVRIAAIQRETRQEKVYNLTVARNHTYYVGRDGVLVHNAGCVTKKGLGGNPFKGKTPAQIDDALRKKGFDVKGTDPAAGKGSYINPKTGRKYYIDKGGKYKKGTELPHVDVHRPSSSSLPKKKLPLGDRLIE